MPFLVVLVKTASFEVYRLLESNSVSTSIATAALLAEELVQFYCAKGKVATLGRVGCKWPAPASPVTPLQYPLWKVELNSIVGPLHSSTQGLGGSRAWAGLRRGETSHPTLPGEAHKRPAVATPALGL